MRQSPFSSVICGLLFSAAVSVGCASSDPAGGQGGSTGSSGSGNSTGSGGSNSTGSGGQTSSGNGGSNTTGSGGHTNSGGTTGSGGSGARGGSTGSGGVINTGSGGRGSGGSNPTGSGGSNPTGSGGSSGTGSCTISNVTATQSTKISTVFTVTFSTSLSKPTDGHIDFGLDTSYGMQAPIDFTQSSVKTLLLGMKASKAYHYKITVSDGANTCSSADQMVMTGALPNGGLPQLTMSTNNKAALYGGFLVTGSYTGSKYQSFILDGDGDYVWWYTTGNDGCGTRMSYDGQFMWINNADVGDPKGANVHRVTMDGMTDTDLSTPFKGESHQLTPLPDGSVAFYATGTNGCDDVKLFPTNGTPSSTAMTVVNSKTAHGGTGMCHLNNIEYDASDDTLVFSDLDNSCLTKVTKTGSTVWVMDGINGVTSTFTGDLWKGGEHGFHIISPTDYLIFNNNSSTLGGSGKGSIALELSVDVSGKKVTKTWSYTANPAINVQVLGDVQRMTDNGPTGAGKGNTIVDYGTGDVIQEVDSSGTVLQQIKSQYPFGFMEKRFSLYGKPTR